MESLHVSFNMHVQLFIYLRVQDFQDSAAGTEVEVGRLPPSAGAEQVVPAGAEQVVPADVTGNHQRIPQDHWSNQETPGYTHKIKKCLQINAITANIFKAHFTVTFIGGSSGKAYTKCIYQLHVFETLVASLFVI